jgi:hypothetical protein
MNYDYEKLSKQFPTLKNYLVINKKSNFTDTYKKFPLHKFDNVRVSGLLSRYKMWEVIYYVSFYVNSTNKSYIEFGNNYEYSTWVRKNKIGLRHIKDEIISNIATIPWWDYEPDTLAFYNHEHTTSSLKLGKKKFFEIEIRLFPPDTLAIANDITEVKCLYNEVAVWISKLNSFQTDEYIQFTATSKENKNT